MRAARRLLVVLLLALVPVSIGSARAVDHPAAGGATPRPAVKPIAHRRVYDVSLSAWSSSYPWSGGGSVGYAGWHSSTTAPGAYSFAAGLGGNPGLWVWPVGDQDYAPGSAGWTFTAPGTTRLLRASLSFDYPSQLLGHHCLEVGFAAGDGTTTALDSRCRPQKPMTATVADPSAAAPASKVLFFRIAIPCDKTGAAAATCTKHIPKQDPLSNGEYARLLGADLTLVDDDAPTVAATGPFVDLDGRYVDGRHAYDVTTSASDAGSGVARAAVSRTGDGEVAAAAAPCDSTHSTDGLDARVCPATFSFTRTVDTSAFPEGTNVFTTSVADYAGNTAAGNSWSIEIDRTPPASATAFALGAYDPEQHVLPVAWTAGLDPALPDGTAGSGVATTEIRWSYDGAPLGPWTSVAGSSFDVPDAFSTHTLEVEVRETDAVGNASSASASFTVPTPDYAVGKPWLLPECNEDGVAPPDFCSAVGASTDDAAAAPDVCDAAAAGLCHVTLAHVAAEGIDVAAFQDARSQFLSSLGSPIARRFDAARQTAGVRRALGGTVIVPNVIGMSASDAETTMLNAGFVGLAFLRATPDSVVLDQEYCGGTDTGIPIGSELGLDFGLFYSTDPGPDPYSCAGGGGGSGGGGGGGGGGPTLVTIPDLSAMTVDQASSTLSSLGLSASVTWADATGDTPVYDTTPDAGTQVAVGSAVQLNFVQGLLPGLEMYGFLDFQLIHAGDLYPGGGTSRTCDDSPVIQAGYCAYLLDASTPVRKRDKAVVGPTFITLFHARSGGGICPYGNDPSAEWMPNCGPIPGSWGSSSSPSGERVHHWGWENGREVGFHAVSQSDVSYYPGYFRLDPLVIYRGANQTGTMRDGLWIHGGWRGHELATVGTLGCIRIDYRAMPTLKGLWSKWTDNKDQAPGPGLYKNYR